MIWSCIRDMPRGRRGLITVKTVVVKDEDRKLCISKMITATMNFYMTLCLTALIYTA